MNYIVLNGTKSTMIGGLLIQELPPITKPMIRKQVLEIDGRDGDIITPLGYSAYDKEMSIGLRGQFDINDVIQYFDSSGEVLFSNEPDKLYRYTITEQIDFERLLRFRTATVVFHCQPFKYSAVDKAKVEQFSPYDDKEMTIFNYGNIYSKPQITITGSGTVTLSLNGIQIFTIEIGDTEYITIDADTMEAYQDGILRNRLVTGDYSNFALQIGSNSLTWTGNVTEISVSNYSRWI